MKRIVATAVALALCTGASYAGGLGLYGSMWNPKDLDEGYGGGVKLKSDLGDVVSIELRGTYYGDMSDDIGANDVDVQVIPVELGLALNIPLGDALVLYAMGGAGYYFLDAEVNDQDVDLDDEVGWYAGGGIEITLGEGVSLFAEGQYRAVEGQAKDDKADDIDNDFDIDLAGVAINAGLLLKW